MDNKSLDKLAGEVALQICNPAVVDIDKLENLTTKALGVLHEQGVYAMMVFLLSKSGDKPFDTLKNIDDSKSAIFCIDKLSESLNHDPMKQLSLIKDELKKLNEQRWDVNKKMSKQEKEKKEKEFKDIFTSIKKNILENYLQMSKSLENLLILKEFYEQTLIYVRHISKGLK